MTQFDAIFIAIFNGAVTFVTVQYALTGKPSFVRRLLQVISR